MCFEHTVVCAVETRQTPEERVAVIKATGHQGIGCLDISLISQVHAKMTKILHVKIGVFIFTVAYALDSFFDTLSLNIHLFYSLIIQNGG